MKTANMSATLMLLAIAAIGGCLAYCPAAYIDLGTGCYHFGLQDVHSWEEAYFVCKLELNGYLVEIESQQEQNNLVAYIKGVADPEGAHAYWLGASDKLKPEEFRWMTSGNLMTFTAWRPNQPDNYHGKEECVVFLDVQNYLWGDVACDDAYNYLQIQRALCETAPIE